MPVATVRPANAMTIGCAAADVVTLSAPVSLLSSMAV